LRLVTKKLKCSSVVPPEPELELELPLPPSPVLPLPVLPTLPASDEELEPPPAPPEKRLSSLEPQPTTQKRRAGRNERRYPFIIA